MSSTVNVYDAPPLRRAGVLDTTTTAGGSNTHTRCRISWAAIFGGVILVVAVQLLLSLLGAGIGLGTVNTNLGSMPTASSLGIGAGVWWVVSSCIALGLGGYVAAWLAGIEIRLDGVLHGLITWGIATLLTIYLLTSAIGGIIGGGTAIGRGGIGGIGGIAGGFGSSGGFGSAGGAGRVGGWIAGCPWPAPVFGCGSRVGAIVGAGCGAIRCDLARVAVRAEVRACGRFLGDADLPALDECEMTGTARAGCAGAWW